jgi:hypothetical protein
LSLAGIELSEPPYNYELALAQTSPDHRGTLIVMISPAFFSDRARLAEFALRHRMRSVCPLREFVEAGGSYVLWGELVRLRSGQHSSARGQMQKFAGAEISCCVLLDR